jgi:hypothetical protein
VIGVALFREKRQEYACCLQSHEQLAKEQNSPPSAPKTTADRNTADRAHYEMESRSAGSPLGTGHGAHGAREPSPDQRVPFQRASTHPDERIVIYYDSYRNLLAKGIISTQEHYSQERPDPFPHGFVPDP